MINKYSLFFIAALLLLGGCRSVPTVQSVTPPIPESMPQGAISGQSSGGVSVTPESGPVMSGNPAVIALLDRAQHDYAGGKRETAGASLERALRIEPRNPWLWHELAQLRFNQGEYVQAISLARKSNSFAGAERRLQALNWRLIGNSRVAQGDSGGADQAFKRATELEQ